MARHPPSRPDRAPRGHPRFPPKAAGRARPENAGTPHGDTVVAIYGFHAAVAALSGGRRRIHAVHATEAAAGKLATAIAAHGLEPAIVASEALSRRLGPDAAHQGILVEAGPVQTIDLSAIESRSGMVLVLDQITDPHNVGAILRTAAAFGVDAVVTTQRHAPPLAGTVAKVASGGLDHVPIATVVNLARALEDLDAMGYMRVGLDSEGPVALATAMLHPPLALVLGAEDKGLRRLTRDRCDLLARLDMPGPIKSLNVSNACAVALTLVSRTLATPG